MADIRMVMGFDCRGYNMPEKPEKIGEQKNNSIKDQYHMGNCQKNDYAQ